MARTTKIVLSRCLSPLRKINGYQQIGRKPWHNGFFFGGGGEPCDGLSIPFRGSTVTILLSHFMQQRPEIYDIGKVRVVGSKKAKFLESMILYRYFLEKGWEGQT